METAVEILQVVAIMLAATVAGGQLFCLIAVIPALPEFTPEQSARIHQRALTDRPHKFLRATSAGTMLSCVAILILEADLGEAAMLLTLGGLLGTLVQGFLSARFEWGINDEINSWGTGPVPEHYPRLRAAWDSKHALRTVFSVVALGFLAAAAVVYQG